VRYVPDGIDISRFARKSEASYGTTQHRDIVIGTVAPLRPEKNIARLIDVFCLVADDPRLRLVIAGDGPERVGLESLAAASGLNHRIVFLGNVARPEELLPSFDVFGLSSDTEQIPNSVLEAMAVGLPIAAVDVGDIRMMVAPTNAPYIVPREDPNSFAAAIRQLVADPSLRSRIGTGNRLQVETRFRQELMFEQYEKLLLGGVAIAQSTPSREEAPVDGHSQRADR
jgi:glycosyltransferase involved in cell wall biosynthesis